MTSFDPKTKIWSGPKVDREEKKFSFQEIILRCLNSTPEKVFQISEDENSSLTYSQLKDLTMIVAQNLQNLGMQPGDAIAVLFKNSPIVAPIVFGSMLNGILVNSFINSQKNQVDWIKQIFGSTKPKIIIIEQSMESADIILQTIRDMGLDSRIFLVNKDEKVDGKNFFNVKELLKSSEKDQNFQLPKVNDNAAVFAIPSSGSTGMPKSIVLSGEYIKHMKYFWNIHDNVVVFSYSTISWFSGLLSLIFPLLNNGLRLITSQPFSIKSYGELVERFKVTTTFASIEACIKMSKSPDFNTSDFSSIKELLTGGERIPNHVREFYESHLPKDSFGIVYGGTECGKISIYHPNSTKLDGNIVGNLAPNARCKIIDFKSGEALGANQVGELHVKTETMFSEYCGRPELTSKAVDKYGWYKTGDVGFFDNQSSLYVHGRVVDMITVQGKLIHPAQIESVFERFEGIKAACALNLVQDDVLAVLCVKSSNSNITEEFLAAKAAEKLTEIEFRGGIHIVDEIPRAETDSRKINRGEAKILALKLMNLKTLHKFA